MKNLAFKAFSLVELLVVITILAIIGVVSVSINDGYKEKTYNTKVLTDLTTIENSLIRYKQENGYIPSPEGNLKYFTKDGLYAHDESEAFGYHGFITEKTIPKKYINVLPKDPRSNHFYAYGKTLSSGFFEVSGVTGNDDKFESIVRGNYLGNDQLYNLIREYNGPDFVYDKSNKNFAYNPEEMVLTARITSYTGELLINDIGYSNEDVYKKDLFPGDNIKLSTGSTAILYYSDGSYSELGDGSTPLELTLSVMKYKNDDNLFTRIRLALNYGTIITKASKLSSESNFDLYTTDTEASVRGTIFEIKRFPGDNKTTITVIKGSIVLNKINIENYEKLLELLKNDLEVSSKYPIEGLPQEVIEIIYTKDGIKESILKGPNNSIEIDNNSVLPINNTCIGNQHLNKLGNCEDNTILCNINFGNGKQDWDFSKNDWGECKVISCISGYVIVGNECKVDNTCSDGSIYYVDKCIPKTQKSFCTGLPNNASRNSVNKVDQDWDINTNKYIPDTTGKYNEIDSNKECRFKCMDSYIWDNTTGKCICPIGKHEENNTCKDNIYECSIVPNGSNIKTWNTTTKTRSTCILKCNSPYQISGNNCVLSITKTANCGGSIPEKASSITPTTYTQTCVGSNCNPILNWDNNKTTCGFKCNTNYSWNGSICKPATQTYKCQPKPPSNTEWNKVDQYIQTWNGSEWSPSNSSTKYDTSSSYTSCRYKCVSGANRNGSSCIKCTSGYSWDSSLKKCKKTISGNGCTSCPAVYLSDKNKIGICLGGKRYERKCGTQVCRREEEFFDCNDVTNYPWSITIYQ